MLADFARRQGMAIRWIEVDRAEELSSRLRRGEGDLIAADLPPEQAQDPALSASLSMGAFRYIAYGRPQLHISDPRGLAGLRVAISTASPLWPFFQQLRRQVPGIIPVVMPPATSRATLLGGVTDGHFDVAIMAAGPRESVPGNPAGFKPLFAVSDLNQVVWYCASARSDLRDALNTYMHRFHAAVVAPQHAFGDLAVIHGRGTLRAITRIDPQNYFVRDGHPAGFEYEMVQWFARNHGLNVEFLIADSDQQMLEWLRSGAGDIITARVRGGDIAADHALAQALSYFHSASVVVGRIGTDLRSVQALAGKRIAVYAGSVEHRVLSELVASGIAVQPVVLSPGTPASYVAEQIENWSIDAAIVDAYNIADLRALHPLLEAGMSLPTTYNYAWTIRAEDRDLGHAVDQFVRAEFASDTYSVLAQRYFQHPRYASLAAIARLSPYDNLVRRYADTYDFDWRLIVAQMYFESQFNPGAVSSGGARGLMQLSPETARAMGVRNPCDPDAGIRGGVRYLDQLRDHFEAGITPRDRTWFALAAYNAGINRVERARDLAARAGLDPTRWFGHVETIMRRMDSGRVLGRRDRTVEYVRGIRSLYTTYNHQQEAVTAVSATAAPVVVAARSSDA